MGKIENAPPPPLLLMSLRRSLVERCLTPSGYFPPVSGEEYLLSTGKEDEQGDPRVSLYTPISADEDGASLPTLPREGPTTRPTTLFVSDASMGEHIL